MKVLITHPTTFERVRRGTERLAEETAACIAAHGYDVTFLSCRPGNGRIKDQNGVRMIEVSSLWRRWMLRFGVREFMLFGLNVFAHLLNRHYDIVYCFSFVDAAAAAVIGRYGRFPTVLVVNGIPTRTGRIFARAVRTASAVVVFSQFARDHARRCWQRDAVVIPAPVDLAQFPVRSARNIRPPVITCTAALDDTRKGGLLLFRALNLLKRKRPDVLVRIASKAEASLQQKLLNLLDSEFRPDVQFLGDGQPGDLSRIYGESTITVLPSIHEAFGMVVIESMATGTPVVGTRHGALVELISDPRTGRLFDPGPIVAGAATNAEGLSEAMLEALELGFCSDTVAYCRSNAEKYSWNKAGPLVIELIESLVQQQPQ